MPLTEKTCFDIAIALITQHNKENLLETFLNILKKHFPDYQLDLHELQNGELQSEQPDYKKLLFKCIESREIFLSDSDNYLLYPVVSLGKITNIITLHGDSLPGQISLLKQLMALFSNQQILLDNNNHDALTGLLNRHSFEQRISSITDARNRRDNENNPNCCFAILDIDFFKRVNDVFGHLYGDEVLILFANIMEDTFRYDDMLFRYGGEEFSVILKDIDLDTAIIVLDRFRQNIEKYDFPQVGTITVSIGVTSVNPDSSRIEVISRADQALYYSKDNGRNQVHSFEALISTGKLIDSPPDVDDIEIF